MMGPWKRTAVALALAVACSATAWGQARSAYTWNSPQLRGLRGPAYNLRRYSTGLGGLETGSPYGGSGLLRSNITSTGNYSLRASSTQGTVGAITGTIPGQTPLKPLTGLSYKPVGSTLGSRKIGSPVSAFPEFDGSKGGGMGYYMAAMGQDSNSLTDAEKPITSFVPTEPSEFQKAMADGDDYFRKGKYARAEFSFRKSRDMARGTPEVHLSMVHAHFANGGYYAAANQIRRALIRLPELPMVKLDLRGFYGKDKEDDYKKDVDDLVKRVEDAENPDLLLLLAYVRYFGGEETEAAKLLRRAHVLNLRSNDKKTREANTKALETFWEGMAGAGKVEGELDQTSYLLRPDKDKTPPPTDPAGAESKDKDKDKSKSPPPAPRPVDASKK